MTVLLLVMVIAGIASGFQESFSPTLNPAEGVNHTANPVDGIGRSKTSSIDLIENSVDLDLPVNQGENLWQDTNRVWGNNNLQRLMQIPISVESTWLTDSNTGLNTIDTSLKFPILKLFGSPPPIVKTGFAFTNLYPGPHHELPRELYEYSIGVSKIYQLGQRWTLRSMLGMVLATDNRNRSSDAWLFRGGLFGIYEANENLQFTVGAIALGRDDLPVVPALGAIWTPNSTTRVDFIPPNPRVNFLISQTNKKENWLYFGGGFDGTSWGYKTVSGVNDQLTYRDFRVVAGWHLRPRSRLGAPYVRGRKYLVEMGYNFQRELEWNDEVAGVKLGDAWMLRLNTSY